MNITEILKSLWLTAKDIIPISLFLIIFQVFVLGKPIDNIKSLALGIVLSTIGLFLFIHGLELGLLPLGNTIGESLPNINNKVFILIFTFILGYASTLAEPSLTVLAMEIEELSVGALNNRLFVHTVALGVGIGMSTGMLKIMHQIPSTYIIIPLFIAVAILGYFAPERITGIAFDSGSVTTGPVTVPLNMAIAIGLSSMIGGSDPLVDGFGIIALTALGPVITVLLLGIIIKF